MNYNTPMRTCVGVLYLFYLYLNLKNSFYAENSWSPI